MNWKLPVFIGLITMLIITSCSVNQQVYIEADGSGTATVRIELHPVFVEYMVDLAEVTGQSFEKGFFDLEKIEAGFHDKEGTDLKRIDSPRPECLEMDINYSSIESLFSGEDSIKYSEILSINKTAQGTSLHIHLDRNNFSKVTELFPILKNPLFEAFGPQENESTTEEEYLELIELALGEEGTKGLKKSFLETMVKVKGTLISQKGGVVTDKGVLFKTPLIRILLLDQPLDYILVFR